MTAPQLTGAADVAMTRDGLGDSRVIYVPRDALHGVFLTRLTGGRIRLLPRPTVAAYVDSDLYPSPWRTGDRHQHRHRLLLLVQPEHNNADVYAELREHAAEPTHWKYWAKLAECMRRTHPAHPGRAVLAYIDSQLAAVS